MRTILIIGGGFCGVACAVQVLRLAGARPVRVLLLERATLGGLAYSRCGAEHLLNVPAGRMSAVDDDAESFLRFARMRLPRAAASDFLPRRLYGDYLGALLDAASRATAAAAAADRPGWGTRAEVPRARLERVAGQAIALLPDAAGLHAILADGRVLHADRVVLATGHFAPCDPASADAAFYADSRYQRDPWDFARLASLHPSEPVLLLGSGLTAVDVALTLLARGVQRITMLSRHGLLPQPHRGFHALRHAHPALSAGPAALWGDATTVRAQFRAFRVHLRDPSALRAVWRGEAGEGGGCGGGGDWRDAMAALRPHTAAVWQAWTEKERKRFLRHVQPYWDSHRHRLAPAAHAQLQRALQDGRLSVMAARALACAGDAERVRITLRRRGATAVEDLWAARVINCTGSCPAPARGDDPLIAQLVVDGILQGAQVARAWEERVRYVGPWLKAAHWEATAVPELRKFAAQAAAWALT